LIIIFAALKGVIYMRSTVTIIILLFSLCPLSQAQLWKAKRIELSAGSGPTLFFSDIGGYAKTKNVLGLRDISCLRPKLNFNANLRYRITREFNARLSLSKGLFYATDERGSQVKRGFQVSTSFIESALIGEYYFIKNSKETNYLFEEGKKLKYRAIIESIDFYLFTGIGGLFYTPSPNDLLRSKQVSDGIVPGNFSVVIPGGIGSVLVFSPRLNFGLELGGRYPFSDTIDGFPSQHSSSKDVYYFFDLSVIYKF
jgi:hypothetical protein